MSVFRVRHNPVPSWAPQLLPHMASWLENKDDTATHLLCLLRYWGDPSLQA